MSERKSFLLRIDSDLWAELESWAQAELRSVNGQIEYVLREAVLKHKGKATPAYGPGVRQFKSGLRRRK